MMLELIHGFENQLSSFTYWMATGDRLSWLPTQVALDVVHHLRWAGKGLLLLAGTKKDVLSLLADEGEGLWIWRRVTDRFLFRRLFTNRVITGVLTAWDRARFRPWHLPLRTECHHQINRTDSAVDNIFRT
jgi:hypothetical protein